MEHRYMLNIDSLPGDVWRLICEQFESLTDLQTVLLLNKSCNNYCQHNIKKEKLWHEMLKSRMGLTDTNIYSLILPSKFSKFLRKHRPSLKLNRENLELNKPIKIVVVGSKSGQTTFSRLISGCDPIGVPTTTPYGHNRFEFVVKSPNRDFNIDLWDFGYTKSPFQRDHYQIGAMAGIVFCDTASRITRKDRNNWIRDISPDIPLVVCLNKVDLPFGQKGSNESIKRELKTMIFNTVKLKSIMFCEISNYAKYCVHEPLIWILQQLTGDDTLELTFPPMSNELHGTVNSEIIRAGIEARKRLENGVADEDKLEKK